VVLNSVPGSGKTSTALFAVGLDPLWSCLLLTYNARLKLETRARAKNLKLTNLEVHSFHSMGVNYWSKSCWDDAGLNEIVRVGAPPRRIKAYDLIIIDEAQDVTPLIFCFINLICRHVTAANGGEPPQFLCVGDAMQSIYQFRHSDKRFLRLADQVMPFCGS
jgi:hypothetical protein